MAKVFSAVPGGMDAFSAANNDASANISSACSADPAAVLAAAAAALGPIAVDYLIKAGPGYTNNLVAGRCVGLLYAGIGDGTATSKSAIIAADND